MNEKQVIIVDEQDNEIGVVPRSEHDKHFYRVSALWVTNSKGEFLLAQRALTKKHHPGKWGPAVAGTVEKGETYLSNIIKETEEEIGILLKDSDFIVGPKISNLDDKSRNHHYFTQWFFYQTEVSDADFNYDEVEVANVKWFTKEDVEQSLETFLPSMMSYINKFNQQ